MTFHLKTLVVGILALLLLAPGCRRAKKPEPEAEQEKPSVSLQPPQGAGVAASSSHRAVARTMELSDLRQFATFYIDYALQNSTPPANAEALGLERAAPNIYKAIKDGDLIVFWGVDGNKL